MVGSGRPNALPSRVAGAQESITRKDLTILIILQAESRSELGANLGLSLTLTERADLRASAAPLTFAQDPFGAALFLPLPATLKERQLTLDLDLTKSTTKVINFYSSFGTEHF